MKSANPNFGLVLTGGGAKGAYQAGALQYIAEIGLQPQIIAGTSIGALNGAVLASYHPFARAVERLNQLWKQLGDAPILHSHTSALHHTISYAAQTFVPTLRDWVLNFLIQEGILKDCTAIYDPAPIEQLLRETVKIDSLKTGIELWVTVFPSLNIPGLRYDWLLDFIRAKMGTEAQWLCVQDLNSSEDIYNLLLASAAIPLAFPSRQVNGQHYVDGALADNVPLTALAKRGCSHVIVIHLQNGSVWNRHDFPEQTIIEIRPELPINVSDTFILGQIESLLKFDPKRIALLKQRGYEDAQRCLAPIVQTLQVVKQQRLAEDRLIASTQKLLFDAPL